MPRFQFSLRRLVLIFLLASLAVGAGVGIYEWRQTQKALKHRQNVESTILYLSCDAERAYEQQNLNCYFENRRCTLDEKKGLLRLELDLQYPTKPATVSDAVVLGVKWSSFQPLTLSVVEMSGPISEAFLVEFAKALNAKGVQLKRE